MDDTNKREEPHSVFSVVLIFIILYVVTATTISAVRSQVHPSNEFARLLNGMARGTGGIIATLALGKIIGVNGFKHAFSTKNFLKGIYAHLPFLLFVVAMPIMD